MLDIHLGTHVEELYSRIRQRALIQFMGPFTSVSMHSMANAFNVTLKCISLLRLAILRGMLLGSWKMRSSI